MFGYLTKPFPEGDLTPAARKAIERAKGLLMAKEGLSEDEAYGRLRTASQASGRPMRVIAEAVEAVLG